jgi:hypothetical protein
MSRTLSVTLSLAAQRIGPGFLIGSRGPQIADDSVFLNIFNDDKYIVIVENYSLLNAVIKKLIGS